MRSFRLGWFLLASLISQAAPRVAEAQDVTAGAPFDVSVTVYRSPHRDEGGFNLNYLQGFALITESRRVVLGPGDQRLRFEGVADGIEPVSAIVTGLPTGVIEKNRDAMLLSPSALIEAAAVQQGRVALSRTDPVTGISTRTQGTIRSGADGGVVFETADGIEALRCSGFAETFAFEASTTGLSATPTLSVRTRVSQPVEAVVQLSYLARGFDWSADYVADRMNAKALNLGGWVTLANANSVSFNNARVQVVAGKLNRESGYVEPIDFGQPILARCWPRGSTSDVNTIAFLEKAGLYDDERDGMVVVTGSRMAAPPPSPPPPAAVASETVEQEELGDLKLYRVPSRTTLASRQAKQVRLLDQAGVPFKRVYEADFGANHSFEYRTPVMILRTTNDKKNNLGLPLPSGRVQLFEQAGQGRTARRLLAGETSLRDLAVDEEVELRFNGGADIQVRQILESVVIGYVPPRLPPLPGFSRDSIPTFTSRVEITNARPTPVEVEIRLHVGVGLQITHADRPMEQKNGRPLFRITVPANSQITFRYQSS